METTPHVCPVWVGYLMNSPLRKLGQNPFKLLGSYVNPGMQVLEIGPALGFFSIPMAAMVAPDGKLYCVDIQQRMLEKLRERAVGKKLDKHIDTILSDTRSLHVDHLTEQIDFCLLANVVHEVPDQQHLFRQVAHTMKSGSKALFIEPGWHVKKEDWEHSQRLAWQSGFQIRSGIQISGSRACELIKD